MFIIVLVMCFAAPVLAETDVDGLLNSAPGLDTYPQASAVILFDRTSIRLDTRGRRRTRREFLCKLLHERAKSAFGDQSIRFDANEDTVIIEVAKSRLPDGTWIEPESDAFTLTSAREVQWASAYSQLKQKNISFPGMAVGAALYLVYRIEPKSDSKSKETPHAGGLVLFGSYEPVIEKRYAIETPPHQAIQYEMINGGFDPLVSQDSVGRSYVWEKLNCEQIIQESNSVGLSFLVPRLAWTTFPDWEALGVFVSDYFWQKVDSSNLAVSEYFKLTSTELTGIPALMNAANFVLWNIRNVSLRLGAVGYVPNSANTVWTNRYGDPRDKAVLLTALLMGYGYAPIPVLIPGSMQPSTKLPVLEQYGDMILAVPTGNDTIWIDPTAEYFPPGTLPYGDTYGIACMLTGITPMLTNIPLDLPESHGARTEFHASLSKAGDLTGFVTCVPQGDNAADARARFRDQKQEEQDIYSQSVASLIGQGTRVTSFAVSNVADMSAPVSVTLGFESPGFGVLQDDLMLIELPGNPFDFGRSGMSLALPDVRYPVRIPGRLKIVNQYTISWPEGFRVTFVPLPLIVENPFFHYELSPKQNEAGIAVDESLEIKADIVPLADYSSIREAYQSIALPKNRLVILEAK